MDEEFNQYEIEAENIGESLKFIVDGMEDICEVPLPKATPFLWSCPPLSYAKWNTPSLR